MSDTSQGPGWWQASDGKWYAPELYPTDWAPESPAGTTGSADGDSKHVHTSERDESPSAADTADALRDESEAWGATARPSSPPDGWEAPVSDRTLVDIPPVDADPTRVQPAVGPPPAAPPLGPPTAWEQPRYDQRVDRSPEIAGGVLALIGAAGLIVGSFMDWAVAAGTLTGGAVNALTGSNGWGTLVAGLFVAGAGVALLAGQRSVWVGAAMAAAALVGLGLAIFSLVDIGNTSDDLTALLLAADPPVSNEVAAGAKLDYDTGMWVVLAGAAVSLVASTVAFARRD